MLSGYNALSTQLDIARGPNPEQLVALNKKGVGIKDPAWLAAVTTAPTLFPHIPAHQRESAALCHAAVVADPFNLKAVPGRLREEWMTEMFLAEKHKRKAAEEKRAAAIKAKADVAKRKREEAAAEAEKTAAEKAGAAAARREAAATSLREAHESAMAAEAAAAEAAALREAADKDKPVPKKQKADPEAEAEAARLREARADAAPKEYLCPITQEVMTDPVTTCDGHAYEREAIAKWLEANETSPATGATLDHPTLTENVALRKLIQDYMEAPLPEKPVAPSAGPSNDDQFWGIEIKAPELVMDIGCDDEYMQSKMSDLPRNEGESSAGSSSNNDLLSDKAQGKLPMPPAPANADAPTKIADDDSDDEEESDEEEEESDDESDDGNWSDDSYIPPAVQGGVVCDSESDDDDAGSARRRNALASLSGMRKTGLRARLSSHTVNKYKDLATALETNLALDDDEYMENLPSLERKLAKAQRLAQKANTDAEKAQAEKQVERLKKMLPEATLRAMEGPKGRVAKADHAKVEIWRNETEPVMKRADWMNQLFNACGAAKGLELYFQTQGRETNTLTFCYAGKDDMAYMASLSFVECFNMIITHGTDQSWAQGFADTWMSTQRQADAQMRREQSARAIVAVKESERFITEYKKRTGLKLYMAARTTATRKNEASYAAGSAAARAHGDEELKKRALM